MNPQRQTFPRAVRLSGRRAFAVVFNARLRKPMGPIVVVARPNGLSHSRIGFSIGRKVGAAVLRHRVKRLLREAFRLDQHALPRGYDWVIVVRPHAPLPLVRYRELLQRGARAAALELQRRDRSAKGPA